jgi:hypothetical protein
MLRFVELLYGYVSLRARQQDALLGLDAEDTTRLEGLERLLRGDGGAGAPRWVPYPQPVQLTFSGGFVGARLVQASADGLRISGAEPPSDGARMLVHLRDARGGYDYVFPVRVHARRESYVELAFDGMPSRTPLGPDHLDGRGAPLAA